MSGNNILITGGTGSFGKEFLKFLLSKENVPQRIVVYSRDELKQWELQQVFPEYKYPQIRFFLGDVRDKNRLDRALQDIDTVVHAAALKQVPAAEYNPFEFIQTNVLGAENLIQACLSNNVKRLVALSTDKAAAPINLYGATKLCSDKLFVAANNIVGSRELRFAVVRYGNVMGSRGSVIPFFLKAAKEGILPITDDRMTRFNISLTEGVEMVDWVLNNMLGAEIFVPKIPSYSIKDMAEAIGPNCQTKHVGIRPGEKLHEEMITTSDSFSTIDLGNYYAILPPDGAVKTKYIEKNSSFKEVPPGFSYNSKSNADFINPEEIRELIKLHIDPSFVPV